MLEVIPYIHAEHFPLDICAVSLQRARKEHAEMKLRRKSRARDPKLKDGELDELAQQAADEASVIASRPCHYCTRLGSIPYFQY